MHGFNRLGGNSLAETIVAGRIVGRKIVEFLEGYETSYNTAVVKDAVAREQEHIDRLISCKDGKEDVFEIRNKMQDELMDRVGIFRNGKDLQKAVDNLQEIHERAGRVGLRSNGKGANPELGLAIKIRGMVKLALCVAYAALQRTESRGCHAREDFEARNDRDWLNRTLATWKDGDDLPTLNYEPVSGVMELPPGDRGYGGGKIID
jgi:fumarate reductase flavoprotein subunit